MANIIPTSASSSFPGCALSCNSLLQAQTLCYPPNVAQQNQLAYDNCFCQQPSIQAIYSTPDSICAAECTIEADRQLLQSWFKNFCSLVGQGQDPVSQTQGQAGGATTTTATSTASLSTNSAGATYTGASTSQGGTSSSKPQGPWFSTHWKWVLMVIILAIGFAIIAGLLVWLKRRHRKKVDAKRQAASGFSSDTEKRPAGPKRVATPDLWGPHQMMQATQGYQYATDGVVAESSKQRLKKQTSTQSSSVENDADRIEVAEVTNRTMSPTRTSKRARPVELEKNARLIGAADRLSKGKRTSEKPSKMTDKDIEASLQGKKKSKAKIEDESEKT